MESQSNNLAEEIEGFAYVYLSKPEIALITDCSIDLLNDVATEEGKAFLKGRLKRKAEFNGNLMKLTDQLSSPAMAIEHKIAETTFVNDNKRS